MFDAVPAWMLKKTVEAWGRIATELPQVTDAQRWEQQYGHEITNTAMMLSMLGKYQAASVCQAIQQAVLFGALSEIDGKDFGEYVLLPVGIQDKGSEGTATAQPGYAAVLELFRAIHDWPPSRVSKLAKCIAKRQSAAQEDKPRIDQDGYDGWM